MIEIRNLKKSYITNDRRVEALRGVNLHVRPRDIFGVIGFSGAGKSTLIRCINRLEEPDGGDIRIGRIAITGLTDQGLREARKGIGMIFQHFNLLDGKTVEGNVAFPLHLVGYPKEKIRERVAEILELVELTDKAKAYPSQLSGGQKQRVGIARALANHPEVLLCDEATSALDPKTTQSILELLRSINEKLGLTIVLITHDMNVVKQICNRVAVLEDGLIVEEGAVAEVFARPQSATLKLFTAQEQPLQEKLLPLRVVEKCG